MRSADGLLGERTGRRNPDNGAAAHLCLLMSQTGQRRWPARSRRRVLVALLRPRVPSYSCGCRVGKTSLLHRYVNNMFMHNYKATIGSDFVVKETEINGTRVDMQVRSQYS